MCTSSAIMLQLMVSVVELKNNISSKYSIYSISVNVYKPLRFTKTEDYHIAENNCEIATRLARFVIFL